MYLRIHLVSSMMFSASAISAIKEGKTKRVVYRCIVSFYGKYWQIGVSDRGACEE
jgi:hypothetical protein